MPLNHLHTYTARGLYDLDCDGCMNGWIQCKPLPKPFSEFLTQPWKETYVAHWPYGSRPPACIIYNVQKCSAQCELRQNCGRTHDLLHEGGITHTESNHFTRIIQIECYFKRTMQQRLCYQPPHHPNPLPHPPTHTHSTISHLLTTAASRRAVTTLRPLFLWRARHSHL